MTLAQSCACDMESQSLEVYLLGCILGVIRCLDYILTPHPSLDQSQMTKPHSPPSICQISRRVRELVRGNRHECDKFFPMTFGGYCESHSQKYARSRNWSSSLVTCLCSFSWKPPIVMRQDERMPCCHCNCSTLVLATVLPVSLIVRQQINLDNRLGTCFDTFYSLSQFHTGL
jgi:hypothetical protein